MEKHNLSKSSEYRIWAGIKSRCYNKKNSRYSDYGGRGIAVCDEWKNSFEAFYQDMGSRPSEQHSVDRKENDKGYCNENCRWATLEEQNNNRRDNVYYTFQGEKLSISQIAVKVGMRVNTLHARLQSMCLEDAIQPVEDKRYTIGDRTLSLAEWCRELQLPYAQIYLRIRRGMLFEEAIVIKELKKDSLYELDGQNKTMGEWCRESGLRFSDVCRRLYKGWRFKEAITSIQSKIVELDGERRSLYFWCELLGLDQDTTYIHILRSASFDDIISDY